MRKNIKNKLLFCFLFSFTIFASQTSNPTLAVEEEAHKALQYLLDEVELDPMLSKEDQLEKIHEFQKYSAALSPEVSSHLTDLLLEKMHARVLCLFQQAGLVGEEVNARLAD